MAIIGPTYYEGYAGGDPSPDPFRIPAPCQSVPIGKRKHSKIDL
ncbi:hypothetical protein TorRG33x02_152380 [Trema orientale]|uniref:Uncharacterized protein n=1 Tax=Trema orientale TaxID=63057 RepID=A0A2P5ETZ4_TREOI|nr:hypothetical protein TorRG33x02_152380 [Trema orientale]